MNYKVAIPTAGLGSRLGKLTTHNNKSLIKLGDVAVISHILDFYRDAKFVIILGHCGEMVRDYIRLAHPELKRNIEYVWVDDFDSDNASMLQSLYAARDLLQEPFIIHTCDTIADYEIPNISDNWTISYDGRSQFSGYKSIIPNVDRWDIHIGISGINNFTSFWKTAAVLCASPSPTMNDISVISMLKYKQFFAKSWLDTGNVNAYETSSKQYQTKLPVLTKTTENIYFRKNRIIKIFSNKRKVRSLMIRAWRYMGYDIPDILDSAEYGYSYKYISGNTLIHSSPKRFEEFLNFCESSFWEDGALGTVFIDRCKDFYLNKTADRVATYLEEYPDPLIVNGIKLLPMDELLLNLKFSIPVFMGIPSRIHGDLVLENVIDTGNSFIFIDWRDTVFGTLKIGDLYYDLAKLSHNLVCAHDSLNKRAFEYKENGGEVIAYPSRSIRLNALETTFWDWINRKSFSVSKIKAIRALIWINMAPLHEEDIAKFLFSWGKLNLQLALSELKYE